MEREFVIVIEISQNASWETDMIWDISVENKYDEYEIK